MCEGCCGKCKWFHSKETGWYDDNYYICLNRFSEYFYVEVHYNDRCEKYENI